MRTPWLARTRNHSEIRARVAGAVTSRSICSDQSAVPNDVHTRSVAPVADGDCGEGRVGLAQEDPGDVGGGWISVGPDLVDGDEQVGVG